LTIAGIAPVPTLQTGGIVLCGCWRGGKSDSHKCRGSNDPAHIYLLFEWFNLASVKFASERASQGNGPVGLVGNRGRPLRVLSRPRDSNATENQPLPALNRSWEPKDSVQVASLDAREGLPRVVQGLSRTRGFGPTLSSYEMR